MINKHILPLVFIFPLVLVLTAQPFAVMMVSASSSTDNEDENEDNGVGQSNSATTGQGFAPGEPNPSGDTDTGSTDICVNNPEDDICPPRPGPPGPGPGPGPLTAAENTAESEQTGGIGAGQIIQRAQGGVNDQLCKTIGGIGNRECQQQAPTGGLQDCEAIAGLGKANCVQSENPDGSGTCLSANGRPFICNTSTGKSISGSGQAGLGGN
jgi:hypothetical protein